MLLSHQHRFIYFKTKKTASTAVEEYFQRYCLPPGAELPGHDTPPVVTAAGVVASRRDGRRRGDLFANHMPAARILQQVGEETFRSYLKFGNVRNPFDRMVSRFWWNVTERGRKPVREGLPFDHIRNIFARYILGTSPQVLLDDYRCIATDGRIVADMFIRFEHLHEDLEAVCGRLGVPFEPDRLGRFNPRPASYDQPFAAYYSRETAGRVAQLCAWELRKFGYRLAEADRSSSL